MFFQQIETLQGQPQEDTRFLHEILHRAAALGPSGRQQMLRSHGLAMAGCFERIFREMETSRSRHALDQARVIAGLRLQVQRLDWMMRAYVGDLARPVSRYYQPLQEQIEELRQHSERLLSTLRRDAA